MRRPVDAKRPGVHDVGGIVRDEIEPVGCINSAAHPIRSICRKIE